MGDEKLTWEDYVLTGARYLVIFSLGVAIGWTETEDSKELIMLEIELKALQIEKLKQKP